ncbi:MAG: hypothetical protein K6G38_01630 [Gammaproteobacteria bacterium]|nr:hypothetical protein [Gammaproteobacteria bacterium]
MKLKRFTTILLSIFMSLSVVIGLTACGKKSGGDTEFTYLLSKTEDKEYYSTYEENPIVQYLSSKEWNGSKISFKFSSMIEGSETDQFNTLIATGQLYDIMDLQSSNYSVEYLYKNEYAMDLTELVDEYMPNYKKLLASNRDLQAFGYSDIDGEKKVLQLYQVFDTARPNFQGTLYRRDWIVKYGVNPSTSAKFTSGYTEEGNKDTYYDDVKFPSFYDAEKKAWVLENVDKNWDGTDPIFISDWEWMFECFAKALKDLNITDGYCYTIPYVGTNVGGDIFDGFGGGSALWYKDGDEIKFGAASDQMESYLECMSTWYANGWLDKSFDERATDMFYTINQSATHAGKVGCWQGKTAEIGYEMEADTFPATEGIMVFGAKQPINDKYGKESTQYHLPDCYTKYSTIAGSIFISTSAEGKDLAALLTMMDYTYGDEGGTILHQGLNKEQQEEFQSEWYIKYGLPNGVIYEEVDEDGNIHYYKTPEALAVGIHTYNAAVGNRLSFGLQHVKYHDDGYSDIINDARTNWDYYPNPAYIISYRDLMTEEQSLVYSKQYSLITTSLSVELPKIIKGTVAFDEGYANLVKLMGKYKTKQITEYYEQIFANIG